MGTLDLGPLDMGPGHGDTPATTAGCGAAPDGPVDAPLVTLAAEELYAMEGTTLYVRTLAEGTSPDGAPVRIAMSGDLQRLTR